MRNSNTTFNNAMAVAQDTGLVPRQFVYVKNVKPFAGGSAESFGFWTGDEDAIFTVIDGQSGLPVARTYYGAVNMVVDNIPRVSDMTIQSIQISVSQIATATELLVRGYDVRLAKVEIHEMALDPASRLPISDPEVIFLGQIDGAPIETPAVGEDGSITFSINSDAMSMLSRINPRKSSYQSQRRRSDDRWGKYAGTVKNWPIKWGPQ
ncbi:hypothetical protein OE766_03595 [Pararhizobium sp. YC-54]|uniref:hypothetical protein n=1 Tax=Pararhizobium sp. YC-54 TaxID=2986920 RepID=UPI0021F7C2FE|nr:hypothetical protein [Pararhizobium sp. YC-54]MCV9997321.1 hypothetical protein [Pararhizobium sp. YC-54]